MGREQEIARTPEPTAFDVPRCSNCIGGGLCAECRVRLARLRMRVRRSHRRRARREIRRRERQALDVFWEQITARSALSPESNPEGQ